jgi:hypothetical protein
LEGLEDPLHSRGEKSTVETRLAAQGCPEQNSFMRSFVAAWGIAQMVRSMTKQSSSSSDNVFGYGILPVRDSANPELASLR